MRTYSVHINQRSIGIGFIEVSNINIKTVDIEEQVVVSELLHHARGYKLGVSIGDTLIAINGKSVTNIDTYYKSKIPFQATFKKSDNKLTNNKNNTSQYKNTFNHYSLKNVDSKSAKK
eukprot:853385_1